MPPPAPSRTRSVTRSRPERRSPSTSTGTPPAQGATCRCPPCGTRSQSAQLDTGAVEVPEPACRLSTVVPLRPSLGPATAPAALDGTSPIPPRMARELVAKAPAFERVLTDPVTGDHLHTASRTYRPSAAMAENLRLIDPVCAVPGCHRNVMTVGEMDHIEEFD